MWDRICDPRGRRGGRSGREGRRYQLHSWFIAGGFDEVDVELVEADVELLPLSTYMPRHLRALPWSAGFFALSDEKQDAALADMDAALSEYRHDDGVRIPFSSYLATATV